MSHQALGPQFKGTMQNGSYPINSQHQADAAWDLRGRSKSYSEGEVDAHIRERVDELGLQMPHDKD